MQHLRPAACSARRASVLLFIAAAVAAPCASAQDQDDPLRFLKPQVGQEVELPAPPEEETPVETIEDPTQALDAETEAPAAPEEETSIERIEDPAQALDELRPGEDAAPETSVGVPDVPAITPEIEAPAENAAAPTASPEPTETATPAPTQPIAPEVEPRREPLRFAVLAGRSAAATIAALAPVQRELSAILERPVEILPISSYEAMIDAQDQRRIDGGFFSAAAFAFAQARCRCLDPIVAPRAADGALAYHAIIVARTGSGIGAVADLKGKTVAAVAGDSLGSRQMQLAGLMAEGNDPGELFGAVLTVASAEQGVRLVAAGSADAAFAWSSLAGAPEQGYSRGTLTDLVARGEIEMSRIAVIWHSPAITHSPFAVLQSVPEAEKARIERFMLTLAETHPEAYDMLNPFYAGGYSPVDAADYSGLAMLASRDVDALVLPEAPAATGSAVAPPITSPEP